MHAFKIFQSLVMAVLTGHILTLTVFASEEGVLLNTSPDSTRTSTVLVLPYGLLAGEFDPRAWNYPYNGLFFSKDLGESWVQLGLAGRGVTDAAFGSGLLFVSTYYNVDGNLGLFVSNDGGQTFDHSGLDFSASTVESSDGVVYLGGYSHGLWVSKNNGVSWEQKIGDGSGWTGPNIIAIKTGKNVTFAATPTKVYKSADQGDTWEEIEQLSGSQVHTFYIKDNVVLAGTLNTEGIYKSSDYGSTWSNLTSWGSYPVSKMASFKNTVFVQKIDQANLEYKLYKSNDYGESWSETGVDPGQRVNSAETLFSYPSYMFISTQTEGIQKYNIPYPPPNANEFMRMPWSYSSENELTEKVTAHFDHQYPLLAYTPYPEPYPYKETTVNYLGFKEDIYANFYSSHNGTDFALPYGKEVLAAAPGFARYYFCDWCGHTIKIDHQNGYQSTYMHLQKEGLVATLVSGSAWVTAGSVVGKIGMSGRTSGPHLHFSVTKDKDANGYFDDFPDGLVDPFSWLDPYNTDPWADLSWEDDQGAHYGTASSYLWNHTFPVQRIYITESSAPIVLGNKTISVDLDDFEGNLFTATVVSFIKPHLPFSQLDLEYIGGTSLSITGKDHYEEDVISIDGEVTIAIDLSDLDISKAVKSTLKVYVWNQFVRKWEPLPTIIDYVNNKLSAKTDHLSHFAVLGDKVYPNLPVSSAFLEGVESSGWFTTLPLAYLSAEDFSGLGISAIYYSTNNGVDWSVYSDPFYIEKDGISTLLYRAEDLAGNLEVSNKKVVKVDTRKRWKDNVVVTGSIFEISTN